MWDADGVVEIATDLPFMKLIPEELRRAHEDRKVVFFCGAGVSVPAGLPSFLALANGVLSDLLPAEERCKPGSTEALAWQALRKHRYDEALEILESPNEGGHLSKHVRASVVHHLTKNKTRTLEKHIILAKLAELDAPDGRIVTTNFDPLFESAQRKLRRTENSNHKLVVHVAPTLPPAKPPSLTGLVYLHGKLKHSSNENGLILSMSNFGAAYLLEGWARRFVIELFRNYHIVFIGYRVEDPTMRYLVSALAAARAEFNQFREAYAFAPYNSADENVGLKAQVEQEWRLKGLKPIAYDSADGHQQLWRELSDWADDHRQGIAGRLQAVARLGKLNRAGFAGGGLV